mmetsp:Transcript_68463/g.216575  ORF Transcript_68463/g.216575 Transcript_68463/m.216575 type:complete len:329 (-) Transcript_68463:85-1071(-)
MAKLLSHHDRFHVHAVLGLLALVHFACRICSLFVLFQDTFTPSWISACMLLVHVLLHATSFQFVLPRNRIFSKPMIWAEFRLHNMLFAYRHVIGCAMGIWFPDFWFRRPTPLASLLKLGLVCLTSYLADEVTARVGCTEKRTTNAMPYPEGTPVNVEFCLKRFYAKSQFVAAGIAAHGYPGICFSAILAIESASFLMTLVRKGIITSHTYHVVYSLALFIMGPLLIVSTHFADADAGTSALRGIIVAGLAVELRMGCGLSKYLAWAGSFVGLHVWDVVTEGMMDTRVVAWISAAVTLLDTVTILATGSNSHPTLHLLKGAFKMRSFAA